MFMQPEIYVVIPVYCEEAGIRLTLQQVWKFVIPWYMAVLTLQLQMHVVLR